ncbi:MAG: Adenylate cyclase [candidate division NC10 bacterium]|nr:Adenylate cyclase [candidate division NC10 bacterium]
MVCCPRCHADNPDSSSYCGNCGAPLGPAGPDVASLTRPLETPAHDLRPGSPIAGKYRIIDRLGAGGMGVVYRAEDLRLKRRVALKFLPPHLVDSREFMTRFLLEAQAAAALSHPNVCVIHEVGESDGQPFIAMEYVEGRTLRERLQAGSLEAGEAVALAIEVAAGLEEAHGKGIIHRDIKSANIMVTPQGRAKVMDFGLAKRTGGTSVTESHVVLGTVAYMSPEQARGEVLDQRTDIWSLGAVLYEMVAGRLPFRGDHTQAVIYAILHTEPEPLTVARPGTARALEQVVGQALAKAPADRYQTMAAFRADLAAVAEGLRPITARARPAAVRLAVLPFANLTGDADQEYLSDGLTQEMITLLGRLHPQGLGVIARTSVMRYKKAEVSIDQIGRELGVGYVLEGSVRREGSRVRVAADLIQVQDQVQIWGDVFEREMAGILALQNDVAGQVSKALALTLLPAEQARLAKARPVNAEAHDAYLRGSYHWTKVTPGDLDIAEKYFDLALEKDPSHAPAHAGRAWVWAVRGQMGYVPPEEAGPKAKAAALRALELDEDLAGAHEVLAGIRTYVDWDWDDARASWQNSIRLNPNVATAQAFYAHFLMIMGHGEEALEHSQRAVELDPFNPLLQAFYAQVLYMRRRYDEAIVAAREAQRLQPDHPVATFALLAITHEMKGMEEENLKAARALAKVVYIDPTIEVALDEGYARGGHAEAMKRGAEALVARLPEAYSMPSDIAAFFAMAGEKGKAIEWLERGFEVHDPALPYLEFPCFDIVREDPRFQDLLRKMRLPTDDPTREAERP